METYRVLSAATCSIELLGNEVGYMQNLEIASTYNLQKVRHLYDSEYQGFVKGYADYTITARRAFVEADSMFGTIESLTNLIDGIQQLQGANIDTSDAIQTLGQISVSVLNLLGQLPEGITGVGDLKGLLDVIQNFKSGVINLGELFTRTKFNLKVKTSTALSDVLPDFIGKKDLWIMEDCKLASRNIRMDIGSIIVMEDVVIYARSFSEPILTPQ